VITLTRKLQHNDNYNSISDEAGELQRQVQQKVECQTASPIFDVPNAKSVPITIFIYMVQCSI